MDRGVGAFRALRSLAIVGAIGILVAACGGGTTTGGTQLAADQTLRFPLNDDIGTFDPAFLNAAAMPPLRRTCSTVSSNSTTT